MTPQGFEQSRLNRVSELEVINDLFRSRVTQLEQTEREARIELRAKDDELRRYRTSLAMADGRISELQKRVKELENSDLKKRVKELEDAAEGSPARKRVRTSPPADGSKGANE